MTDLHASRRYSTRRSQAPAVLRNRQGAGRTRFDCHDTEPPGVRSAGAPQDEHREAFCFASIWFSLPTSCRLPHICSRNDARSPRSAATSLSLEGAFSSVEKSFLHSSTFQYLRQREAGGYASSSLTSFAARERRRKNSKWWGRTF